MALKIFYLKIKSTDSLYLSFNPVQTPMQFHQYDSHHKMLFRF